MTNESKHFIEEYKKGNVLLETLQMVYNKNHITKEEFKEVTGQEPATKVKEEVTEEQQLLSSVLLENAEFKEKLKEQQELCATLALQIAELKGGNANV